LAFIIFDVNIITLNENIRWPTIMD